MICMVNKPIQKLAVENEASPFECREAVAFTFSDVQHFECFVCLVVFIYVFVYVYITIYLYCIYRFVLGSLDSIGISEYIQYSFA